MSESLKTKARSKSSLNSKAPGERPATSETSNRTSRRPAGSAGGEAFSRAAVIDRPRSVVVHSRQRVEPAAGQVRVRLEGCGVCGSNVPTWEGRPWFQYPLEPGAPGHEGWGVVDAVGDGVQGLQAGDRVALLSYHAFADDDVAPADAVLKLPPECDGRPFPGEPLACAMNVFRRSDVQTGHTVAIVGIGFLGALLTQLCTAAGARVVAISRRQFARQIATECGALAALPQQDVQQTLQAVAQATGQQHCDRVIEATGHPEPLDLAGQLTRIGGRLIIAGYHQDGPRQIDMQLWNWRGLDVINAHERDPAVYMQGMRDAVAAIADGRMDPHSLYTHRFPLDRLADALECTRTRPDGFLKALITTDQ